MRAFVCLCGLWLPMSAGMADTAFIVAKNSHIPALSKEQISDIYFSKLKTIAPQGQVQAITYASHPMAQAVYSDLLQRNEVQLRAYWSKVTFIGTGVAPREVGSQAEMRKLVASNPNLIGYIDASEVDTSVKVVFSYK